MFIAIIIAGHLRGLNETHNYIKKIEIEKIDREKIDREKIIVFLLKSNIVLHFFPDFQFHNYIYQANHGY